MSQPAVALAKTDAARQLLSGPRGGLPQPLRMLLISVDGRRSAAQLLDIARSLGLGADALHRLHREGLVIGPASSSRRAAAVREVPVATAPVPAPAPEAVLPAPRPAPAPLPAEPPAAVAPPAVVAPAASAPGATPAPADDLRRLMRAKMFALDLAGRMLAGRDADLRASARLVDSEQRFLEWMAEAAARIEAVASVERAQLFRERVAEAAA